MKFDRIVERSSKCYPERSPALFHFSRSLADGGRKEGSVFVSQSSRSSALFPNRSCASSNQRAAFAASCLPAACFPASSISPVVESRVREVSPANSADEAPPPPPSATRSNGALPISAANKQSQTAAWPRENPLRPKTIRPRPFSQCRPRRDTRESPPANPAK